MSPFHEKYEKFFTGRKGWKDQLTQAFKDNNEKIVWFHAASLGEFEQGRPVIEQLKQSRSDVKVLLTFFSPSGYEIKKNYEHADWVFYLPTDSPSNALFFIKMVNPTITVFIKYEFWYFFLTTLKTQGIPVLMISGIFRENQLFFHWTTDKFYQKILKAFHHFFVQDEKSMKLISPIVGNHVTVSGDTRFDRVLSIAKATITIDAIEKFKGSRRLMVLGSTWSSDMNYALPLVQKYQGEIKFIIAPHNVDESEVVTLESNIKSTIRFSEISKSKLNDLASFDAMIIDNIGMLSSIYRYGDFAFIGGAFRGALHNTLEAAAYGIPVCFGENKNNKKFIEASELVASGGGFTFSSVDELIMKFGEIYENKHSYSQMSKAADTFVKTRSGATELILLKLLALLP